MVASFCPNCGGDSSEFKRVPDEPGCLTNVYVCYRCELVVELKNLYPELFEELCDKIRQANG
jgi:hypothetical protein